MSHDRSVRYAYIEPLDAIWLTVAARVGFKVNRSGDVYASSDGQGVISIGDAQTLDPDDCLAQMILHELCHSMVEGHQSLTKPDWGLDNETARDEARELACVRLQAALAGEYGLRRVLAPTTEFRAAYDALPADPMCGGSDPSIELAQLGLSRAREAPWGPHLHAGLRATRGLLRIAKDFGARDPRAGPAPLWEALDPS